MTTIQISLHDGTIITIENLEDYNSTELTEKLNDPNLIVVQIGQTIINKNVIKVILPVSTTTA